METELDEPPRPIGAPRYLRFLVYAAVLILAFYGSIGWAFSSKIRSDGFAVDTSDSANQDRPDPLTEHGLEFENVVYQSDLGAMPAWHLPGATDNWVILVHGKGANLQETLRVLPTIAVAGYHALAIEYRNDPGTAGDPSGEYAYRLTEWADVESAVEFALAHGADRLVLFGYSMGGGIVTNFILSSELGSEIDAIVLDAPMLNFEATIDHGGDHSSLPLIGLPVPRSLTNVAKTLANIRFDIDWDSMDYLAKADELGVPILVFHGTDDDRVPLKTSSKLAALRPDLVTLEIFEGAAHVRSWDADPDRYERTLATFLDLHLS